MSKKESTKVSYALWYALSTFRCLLGVPNKEWRSGNVNSTRLGKGAPLGVSVG